MFVSAINVVFYDCSCVVFVSCRYLDVAKTFRNAVKCVIDSWNPVKFIIDSRNATIFVIDPLNELRCDKDSSTESIVMVVIWQRCSRERER